MAMSPEEYQQSKDQLSAEIRSVGWHSILKALTPLSRAIDNFDPNRKSPLKSAFDIPPCCESKSGKKFTMCTNSIETGYGRCWKCGNTIGPIDIITAFNGCDVSGAYALIKQHLGFKYNKDKVINIKPWVKPEPTGPTKKELNYAKWCKDMMNKVWSECYPLTSPEALPVRKYFINRGLTDINEHIGLFGGQVKCHPSLDFFISFEQPTLNEKPKSKEERQALIQYAKTHKDFVSFSFWPCGAPKVANMGKHPAVILMIRNPHDGSPKRIHRQYIDNNGCKIDFDNHPELTSKMMMSGGVGSEITGCSVLLEPAGSPIVGVAEGLETSLAVKVATGMPMNCTISASGMAYWEPAVGTQCVFIWKDKDRSKTGDNVAETLRERLELMGIKVFEMEPPIDLKDGEKTIDWLDILNRIGYMGFPAYARNWLSLVGKYNALAINNNVSCL